MINMKKIIPIFCLGLMASCGNNTEVKKPSTPIENVPAKTVVVPDFNADSAYYFVKKQVDFGPRIPGTPAHTKAANWYVELLKEYADSISIQEMEVKTWDQKLIKGKNIQAFFSPQKSRRVLLSAHWDTRPFSDRDLEHPKKTFDGADDGASGIGILLEIARVLKNNPNPEVGVDMVFFDVEDWGNPDIEDTYCLGSQYWAKNFKNTYKPYFGINLDMVGAADARFAQEGYSNYYASPFVYKIWNTASRLGYTQYFVYETVPAVIDDHYYVSKFAGIPSVDIINYNKNNSIGFGAHWHTQKDNMSVIHKATLDAVGSVVLNVVYNE